MNAKPYLIPAEATVFEEEIKKSHFITYLAHTPSIEEAKALWIVLRPSMPMPDTTVGRLWQADQKIL